MVKGGGDLVIASRLLFKVQRTDLGRQQKIPSASLSSGLRTISRLEEVPINVFYQSWFKGRADRIPRGSHELREVNVGGDDWYPLENGRDHGQRLQYWKDGEGAQQQAHTVPAPRNYLEDPEQAPNGDDNAMSRSLQAMEIHHRDSLTSSPVPVVQARTLVSPPRPQLTEGGLLLGKEIGSCSSKRSPNSIVVYNPLSQQWRQISLPASFLPTVFSEDHRGNPFECFLLGMVVDRNTGCYKVVVSGLALEIPQPTFTFDSRTGSWQASTGEQGVDNNGVFGGKMRIGEWRRKKRGVQCGGNLYWFIQYERRMHPKSGALLKYNVESQVWEVLMESGLSQCVLPEFHMAVHKGDVIMVNWNDSNCYRGVGHLEIENLGDEIKLMDYGLVSLYHNAEPEKFWKQFLPIKCLAEGGTFYIVHVHHLDCHIPRVLVYRPSEPSGKKFSWLPPWEDLRDDNLLWTFTPTLKAFV
ncbi:hypothetical protein AXG93_3271s1250 [Marchantia polymorpha subsp. ruderalis]|uniref:F-box associated domain-containing protein n=1 Tax=Marchantia polymorpha subsp. ruderalis TaxID=1480154 RepID=A0A176VPF4_MARPO|nr:hypothetical protein AXG93_3271s1250 [Marchantia polymorpha subsp. ruderalis]